MCVLSNLNAISAEKRTIHRLNKNLMKRPTTTSFSLSLQIAICLLFYDFINLHALFVVQSTKIYIQLNGRRIIYCESKNHISLFDGMLFDVIFGHSRENIVISYPLFSRSHNLSVVCIVIRVARKHILCPSRSIMRLTLNMIACGGYTTTHTHTQMH